MKPRNKTESPAPRQDILPRIIRRLDELDAELVSESMRHMTKVVALSNEIKTARRIIAEMQWQI